MKLSVRGHNLKITPAIRDYAEKKLAKFEGFYDRIVEAVLELEVKTIKNKGQSHVASISLRLPKHASIHAEAATADIYASIDAIVEKVATPLKKYQDKFKDSHKKINFVSRVRRYVTQDFSDLEPHVVITYEPKAAAKPMDPIEAVLQLNKTKNSFFVFNNSKTHHQISIVYDRKNGTYGLQTFKKMYMKRAKIKKFKEMPADQKYTGSGVKITKIKDIEASEMTSTEAAARLANSADKSFITFINPESGSVNVIYKKKETLKFGIIEPTM
jgi:putative sigma-54 modulation protein